MKSSKKLLFILIIFITFFATGCWNYRGLNEMTIIAGIAIDKFDDNYNLSFEIYNLQDTAQGDPIKSQIIEATGKTIFEAVRNAKKRVANKLYFPEAKIMIVSEKIAKEDGINSILDWFMRDAEIRENLTLIVSQEETAKDLLTVKGLTNTVVSNDLKNIIKKDKLIVSSTEDNSLYKIYNTLNSEGISLTLPAVHLTNNNEKEYCEINGIAIFKKDKLINYLTSEETKYYLLAKGELKGGILTINTDLKVKNQDLPNISFKVMSNKTSQKYTSEDEDNLKIKISTDTKAILGEYKNKKSKLSQNDIKTLETEAEKVIKTRIEEIINKIQNDYNTDILGFGSILYQSNPKAWKKINNNFNNDFKNIKVDVETKIKIINIGFIK